MADFNEEEKRIMQDASRGASGLVLVYGLPLYKGVAIARQYIDMEWPAFSMKYDYMQNQKESE